MITSLIPILYLPKENIGDYVLGGRTEVRMTCNTVKNRIEK